VRTVKSDEAEESSEKFGMKRGRRKEEMLLDEYGGVPTAAYIDIIHYDARTINLDKRA
jgi:hypothetical protein